VLLLSDVQQEGDGIDGDVFLCVGVRRQLAGARWSAERRVLPVFRWLRRLLDARICQDDWRHSKAAS